MHAIVMTEHGGPGVLTVRELPDPVPADGDVALLRELGAHEVLLDDGALAGRLDGGVDAVLDLVGTPVLRDSLPKVERGAFAAAPKLVVTVAP